MSWLCCQTGKQLRNGGATKDECDKIDDIDLQEEAGGINNANQSDVGFAVNIGN
jgi:hypothetical protein